MKPGLKNVNRVKGPNGRYYYYHRPTGRRLPDDPSSREFQDLLRQLNSGRPDAASLDISTGSFRDLVRSFKASPAYIGLAPRTRHDYRIYLDLIEATFGTLSVEGLRREHVLELRDSYAAKPRKATYVVQVFSRLLSWALDYKGRFGIESNVALGIKRISKSKSHEPWTLDQFETFMSSAPEHLRVAVAIGYYTGLRQGDVLQLTWSAFNGEGFHVSPSKARDPKTVLWIPCHRELKPILEAERRRQDDIKAKRGTISPRIVTGERGRPLTNDGFRANFFKELKRLGLAGLTFHGLRHSAATALADAGNENEGIMSITGHRTEAMVRLYTMKAKQKRRADEAMRRWEKSDRKTEKAGSRKSRA